MLRKMKAIYHQGVLNLEEPLPLADGTYVRVTVSGDEETRVGILEARENSWDALIQLLKDCSIDAGVSDFARSHDRYLYGTDVQSDK